MSTYYHDDVTFEDPAFGELNEKEVNSMWKMLIEKSKGNLQITYHDIVANEEEGSATWEARYVFSKSGRPVHNTIKAKFRFKDGLIVDHRDHFSLWHWSSQALGYFGAWFGFLPFVQNRIRKQSRALLDKYMAKQES